ncbi:substrate-binding domain-containing protein [Brachyspira hampsonii]|uniref:substrate-binding domain-containing protein n=1 Tax=Brachyspira hampsonii TaxID=1287055 RepID=UPI000D3BAE4A|nr:substrate-binding domain-containing protein [Brachyspira hampsonii]PTY40437.1 phosphate ABC transporter substrate-binding protein [Brachyspira hampsonii bv. II]
MKKILILLILSSMFMLISCAGGASNPNDVVITGSSSVSPLMFKLAAKFEELNPDYIVRIETSDSTIGIQDTVNGNNNIGMASRNLKEDELSGLDTYLLCQDGIVIIANKDADINQISEEELYNLYMMNTAVNGITKSISREDGSGTRSAFTDLTLIGKENPLPSTVEILDATGKVKTSIMNDASKIGYISLGSIDDTIKPLAYKAKGQSEYVSASVENIQNNSYKLYRPFYIFTKKGIELDAGTKAFLDFINSETGKTVINENGYVAS